MNKIKTSTLREKKQAIKKMFFGTSFRFGLLALIAVFLVLDVVQMSRFSTKGHEISKLESEIKTLRQETRRIEFEIAQNRSMASIQSRLQRFSLVQAESPEYVVLREKTVALR